MLPYPAREAEIKTSANDTAWFLFGSIPDRKHRLLGNFCPCQVVSVAFSDCFDERALRPAVCVGNK